MKKIKLGIVDDQLLFRKGLISLLSNFRDMEVLFEAADGNELFRNLAKSRPDLILLDLEMPGMDGREVTMAIRKKYPDVRILMLSMYDSDEIIADLISRGANGFLLKDSDVDMVAAAIRSTMKNGYYFSEVVSAALVRKLVNEKDGAPVFEKMTLSDREIEVVRLICLEMTNKEIAEKLNISVRTVDGHRLNILKKTKAKNAIGIVMYAMNNKLLNR